MYIIGKWVVTDPNTDQRGRYLSEYQYEFEEGDKTAVIDIRDYTMEQIENCINSYGYSLVWTRNGPRNIWELYGEETMWIVAECIFEMEVKTEE